MQVLHQAFEVDLEVHKQQVDALNAQLIDTWPATAAAGLEAAWSSSPQSSVLRTSIHRLCSWASMQVQASKQAFGSSLH